MTRRDVYKKKILSAIEGHFALKTQIAALIPQIEEAALTAVKVIENGGTLYICGNGGSAADSQHFAAELVGKFAFDRPPVKALALTTDSSALTCIGNDYGFDKIFERQAEAFLSEKDIFFVISTSGNSDNVLKALNAAKKKKTFTVALLGNGGGKIANQVDLPIVINSDNTANIQEMHILIIHILCSLIETQLFRK